MQLDEIDIIEEVSTINRSPTKTDSCKYDSVWKDKLISFNNNAIIYDAIGNPLTYAGYTYTWKQGRQLAAIAGNGLNISFLYNDAGIRTQKTSGGVVTKYHIVGDKVTYEESGTDRLYYTYDSAGKLVSMNLSEKYNIIGGASSDIGLFESATNSGVSLVDAAIPQTTTTARAIRLNANASIPAITSSALYLKANTNYTLEFDYWSDTDGKQFKTDLFPDDLPQSTVTANKAVQHFKWTLNSSSTNMAIAKLRFFNDIINPNPSNIYITNIKLYEVNNTKEQSNEYYYIRNAQGDIIGIIDKVGTQVVSYTYDSWGQLVSVSGRMAGSVGIKNPYRYRGYRYDTETKLYYLQSRYYDPEWGRFVNADSYIGTPGEPLSFNMFSYCENNPINRDDQNGEFWGELVAAVATAITLPEAIVATVVVVAVVAVASFAYSCYDYYKSHNMTYADSSEQPKASGQTQTGPYSGIDDPATVGEGKNFTQAQKKKIIDANMARNGGVVKSDDPDDPYQELVKPQKSVKGVTPPANEYQIDHVDAKTNGGTNSFKNARVISRYWNRLKWDK